MSITVRRTDGTTLVEIADQTIDTSSCSLALVGRGAVGYGQAVAEDLVHLLENFSNSTAPAYPISGQLSFDTTIRQIKLYDGSMWKIVGSSSGGTDVLGAGITIAGNYSGGSRLAGSRGLILTYGSRATTVDVQLSEGRIVSVTCMEAIANANLPATVSIEGVTYSFASRFPYGLSAGTTLASDTAGYVFDGTSVRARYADVAERYATSERVQPGDVVELGGEAEIRKTSAFCSTEVFGVISSSPAFILNSHAGDDETHPLVAMVGRVPCRVSGPVRKGQRLVSSAKAGVAEAAPSNVPFQAIIGRALQDKFSDGIELVKITLAGVK
jgi:hypothetical protein